MERKEKIEIIQQAIKQLIEEEEENTNIQTSSFSSSSDENFMAGDNDHHHHHHQLLSKLLAELESLESKEKVTQSSQIDEQNSNNNEENIIKELKNLKRQNLITHCLLSAMIVVTLTWQLSEVSLILKIKDGLNNPLKSVGGLIGGFLRGGRRRAEADVQEAMRQATANQKQVIECSSIPGIKIPHLDLPGFDTTSEGD